MVQEEKYKIRFFFDYLSSCFWSGNKRTKERFGYPIEPRKLPLSAETIARAEELSRWFNDSLNWDYPPDPGPWRQEECDRFNRAVQQLFEAAGRELGEAFELHNEQGELMEDPELDEYLKNPKAFKRKSE